MRECVEIVLYDLVDSLAYGLIIIATEWKGDVLDAKQRQWKRANITAHVQSVH